MKKSKQDPRSKRYAPEDRVRIVKTIREQNLTAQEIKQLYGISQNSYYRWSKLYKEGGEQALLKEKRKAKSQANQKFKTQILEVKRKYPDFGVPRIWHWIRRTLFLPVTRSEIESTLKEEGLLKPNKRRKKYERKIKRFERSLPNQMWQCDITMFNIVRGLKVYLIGYMDDHSRYMVGWGLYAGQSSGLVLEVLRNAISKYGCPQELLTDNGRQFTSWHGETDFERELKQDGIRHIKSRPHHPQTLGKIESFWGHMKRELLAHVVMGGLEDMRERLAHWINYYNFQRPHEGIENATPAERFFKYSEIAKREIERQVKKNEKELALKEKEINASIAEVPLGDKTVQIIKEGNEFKVIMKGDENETEKTSSGDNSGSGSGGQGESIACASDPLGRENDLSGVQGDTNKTLAILQDGKQNDQGNAASGENSGHERKDEGPVAGSGNAQPENRTAQAGSSEDAKPNENVQETAKPGEWQNPQIQAQEPENKQFTGGPNSASGPAAESAKQGGLNDAAK